MEKSFVRLNDIMPIIKEKLLQDGKVIFTPNGTSMLPLIVGGKDEITLVKVEGKLQKNDIPLFVRENGAYVLHRIIKVCKDGTYIVRGDNQFYKEKGIKDNQIIAKVISINKNGVEINLDSKKYKSYLLKRKISYPFRFIWFKIKEVLRKIFKSK